MLSQVQPLRSTLTRSIASVTSTMEPTVTVMGSVVRDEDGRVE
jgi:hypothetical protein